jgi:hypothetical protein
VPAIPAPNSSTAPAPQPQRSTWRLIFRIFRWSTYAAALITLIMIFHSAPAPVIATSPQAAARVDQKIAAAEQSLAAGSPATLRLDETELNSYLVTHLDISPRPASAPRPARPAAADAPPASSDPTAGVPAPSGTSAQQVEQVRSNVRDVKVQLIDDRLRAFVVFDFHGKDLTLQLEGRLSSSAGYLRFDPTSGQIGSLPLPQSALQDAMRKVMDSPENREKLRLPAAISDLRIENGQLIATYR